MATITVKKDGTGDYTSLTSAFAVANTYDVIEIQDSGTYYEGNLSRIVSHLTIRAGTDANGNKYTPTLNGGGTTDCAIKFYNNWVIDGLTITDYDGTATYGAGLVSVSGNRVVTIKNCTIHNLDDTAISGLKNFSTVENCIIYDIRGSAARGIDSGTQSATINNCLVYDVEHDGIQSTPSATVIEHCTLHNVGYGGGTGGYGIAATLGSVKFCIVSDPNHNINSAGIRAAIHIYNCVSGSEGATNGNYYGGAGTGDIEVNPMLVTGSFMPSSLSPCLGAAVGSTRTSDITGDSVTWQYTHKVNGVSASATPNDMGAYEYSYASVAGINTNKIEKISGV